MNSFSQELAKFVVETKFGDLSEAVVHEAKRILLDSIGCGLAGITTDKGKIFVELARRMGGPPESSIIGIGDKVSCFSAASANGELINAWDYEAVVVPPGHITTYVVSPPLAVAESSSASGKDLILALALGHEIPIRISRGMSVQTEFVREGAEKVSVKRTPVHGYTQSIFGGTVGAGKVLKLNHKKMIDALGIAGHICPVASQRKWEETTPSPMAKYGSAGWLSTAGVTAALLADLGYVGDTTVFDGEYGFWRFIGSERWEPEMVMEEIGEKWFFLETRYKFYPHCYVMHACIDCFISIIEKNDLMPEDIESVDAFLHTLVELPVWRDNELTSADDGEFNPAYPIAAAAYRIKVEDWHDLDIIRDPKIREFIKKVTCHTHPRSTEIVAGQPIGSWCGMVEVKAKGKTFKEERMEPKGSPLTDVEATDEELVKKFRRNAAKILTQDKIDEAVETLLELEKVEDIAELAKQITL